jgi:hypothetical protein
MPLIILGQVERDQCIQLPDKERAFGHAISSEHCVVFIQDSLIKLQTLTSNYCSEIRFQTLITKTSLKIIFE